MSREQERIKRSLEKNPAAECNKIRQKYCPELFQDFAGTKDSRHSSYTEYTNGELSGTMFYKGIAGIKSMQSMTYELNREKVAGNLYRFMGKEQGYKMKATIVLITDNDAENYGRKLMLEAHRYGKIGFEMARLPQHVSLKQPFAIPGLENMEVFFDGFTKELCPFDIEFVDMDIFPTNVLGGVESGCMSLRVKETPQLVEAQKRLNQELYKVFGPCPAEHDNDYIFHRTFAIGGADYESYQKAYDELVRSDYHQRFRLSKLGLLYYDDDNITLGTYFCYKVCDI